MFQHTTLHKTKFTKKMHKIKFVLDFFHYEFPPCNWPSSLASNLLALVVISEPSLAPFTPYSTPLHISLEGSLSQSSS